MPQVSALRTCMFSLFLYDCMAFHSRHTIKFAANKTSLIPNSEERAYRDENPDIVVPEQWPPAQQSWSLSARETHPQSSFRFLGLYITKDLSWSQHSTIIIKAATQSLISLRRPRRSWAGTAGYLLTSSDSPLKVSWLAASVPGMTAALLQTIKLHRDGSRQCGAPAGVIWQPCRSLHPAVLEEEGSLGGSVRRRRLTWRTTVNKLFSFPIWKTLSISSISRFWGFPILSNVLKYNSKIHIYYNI